MPVVSVKLKVKVEDEMVLAEIVRNWERSIVGSGACNLREYNVP